MQSRTLLWCFQLNLCNSLAGSTALLGLAAGSPQTPLEAGKAAAPGAGQGGTAKPALGARDSCRRGPRSPSRSSHRRCICTGRGRPRRPGGRAPRWGTRRSCARRSGWFSASSSSPGSAAPPGSRPPAAAGLPRHPPSAAAAAAGRGPCPPSSTPPRRALTKPPPRGRNAPRAQPGPPPSAPRAPPRHWAGLRAGRGLLGEHG